MIFITESWLNPAISDGEICGNCPYKVVRKDRLGRKGGGVCALVHCSFVFEKVCYNSRNLLCDVVCFDVFLPSMEKHRFIAVYRPPQCSSAQDNLLLNLISDLTSSHMFKTTVVGDFNLAIDWIEKKLENPSAAKFSSAFKALGLVQLVRFPTRGDHILDLVLSNAKQVSVAKIHPPLNNSDHNVVEFTIAAVPSSTADKAQFFDYKKANIPKISHLLNSIDWLYLFDNYYDVNDVYLRFVDVLRCVIAENVPKKNYGAKISHYPRHISNLFGQKNRLFFSLPNPLQSAKYLEICKSLDTHLKKFMANRTRRLARSSNIKGIISYLNHKIKYTSSPPVLIDDNGFRYSSDFAKAEALASFFESTFTDQKCTRSILPMLTREKLSIPCIQYESVLKLLKTLKPSFSETADGIPQIFYKMFAESLAWPLTHILNISLLTGQIPLAWKAAVVTPIPKNSGTCDISGHRPISILPAPLKIMEKIIRKHLYEWLLHHKIIPLEQHGFLSGASTCTQLIDCTDHWTKSLNTGKNVDVVYFDLSKAFDTVCHEKLIQILESIGVGDNLLEWFKSYLSDRMMIVRYANSFSFPRNCPSGVPQGGILSPLLFLLYTHDLPLSLKTDIRAHVSAYADDIKVYIAYSEDEKGEANAAITRSVKNMIDWCKSRNLRVNLKKSHLFSLGKSSLSISTDKSVPLPMKSEVRDLGIIIKNDLKFSNHIEQLVAKGSKIVHCLFRNIYSNDISLWIKVYKMFVLPIMEYCSPVWSPYLIREIRKLEDVQRTFTRILYYRIFPDQNYPHSLPSYKIRLQELNMKSLFYRRIRADLILGFKILKGELRLRPSRYWVFRPTYGRRSGCLFGPPGLGKLNRQLRCNHFFFRSCKWLQQLPPSLLSLSDSTRFKKALDKFDILQILGIADVK